MRPDPLRSLADYELYLYTLSDSHTLVEGASLVLVRRGATLARVSGEVRFPGSIRLVVRERLVFEGISGQIEGYGYITSTCHRTSSATGSRRL